MKKKIKTIIIIMIIMLFLFITAYGKFKKSNFIENFLIFNLYENSENIDYSFDLCSDEKQTQNVNLFDTVKINSLANHRIAPGTNGEFSITLISSKKYIYKIQFQSLNCKPKNLVFNIKNDSKKYNSLEELEDNLKGTVNKQSTKRIFIEWSWEYEISSEENIQDTLDGKMISTYNFNINIFTSV